jgi:RimJ/RimL family protein N-acetyltransferase
MLPSVGGTRGLRSAGSMMERAIATERLELVVLGPAYLASWLARSATPDLGFADPEGFLAGLDDVVALRLDELMATPSIVPWILRAIVLRSERVVIGTVGFHAAPDARGRVELGYEVVPAFRRRGYAREAATGMMRWAAEQGARIVRASVSPDNAASLAMIARLGFVQVGERLDDEDGPELVFERTIESPDGR